jgi:NADPH-ferrihemoprotein reductase
MASDLDDYAHHHLRDFPVDKVVVFVLATYGEGDPTDNANNFHAYLTRVKTGSLPNIRYFACGLGNRNYRLYNRFVDVVDERLIAAGAQRLGYVGKLDEATGARAMEEAFREWKTDMLGVLGRLLGQEERGTPYEPSLEIVELKDRDANSPDVYLGEPNQHHLLTGSPNSGPFGLHNPYAAPVLVSRDLIATDDRSCIHMEFDLSGAPSLRYRCGDHLAVWPINPEQEVNRLATVLGWDANMRHTVIDIQPKEPGTKVPIPTPTTSEAVLRHYLEICGPVSRDLVGLLRAFGPSESSQEALRQAYDNWSEFLSRNPFITLSRLLELADPTTAWRSVPLAVLIEAIPKLQPRYYSIASSPAVAARRPAITATVVAGTKTGSSSSPFHGVATNYLLAAHHHHHHHHRHGHSHIQASLTYTLQGPRSKLDKRILIHIRPSTFKLPPIAQVPIIMIGAGTGIAPFRGFIQERAKLASSSRDREVGQMLLFFGCRHPEQDFLYKDEWEHFARVGAPLEVVTAFSRFDPDPSSSSTSPSTTEKRKRYVQDYLPLYASRIATMVVDQGAYVYICGSVRMARAVRESLVRVLAMERGWKEHETREWVEREIKASSSSSPSATRRLQEDVWET